MNMIEVDTKLFITCRLCLDETGLYQIVPKVQMQIKYCFEIDVQPFDGLPQLICKKCESILSQYAGIKQMYQVKQNSLKTVKKKSAQEIPEEKIEDLEDNNTIQQQQDTVSSTQQVESVKAAKKTNKQLLSLTRKVRSVDCESSTKSNDHSTPIKPTITKNQAKHKIINKPKKKAWASNYTKQFVCRFCSKSFSEKKNMISHINVHENLIIKHSSILNTHCEIIMNKVGFTVNKTNSDKHVVLSKDKIINSVNSKYYILYNSNTKNESSAAESSDEELIRNVGKYKRQRLISEDSVDSTINTENDNSQTSIDIEKQSQVNNIMECDDEKSDSFIDCVNVDSDSTSTTKVSDTEKSKQKLFCVDKKLVSNIVTMCYKKYLKRFDNSKSGSKLHGNMDSFLQHKVLSIGTKTIHSKGLNSTGLLRYLEHKNLNISWTQTKHSNSPIIVQTSLVNGKSTDNDINDLGWKSLHDTDPNHTTQDFVDIFENLPPRESSPAPEDREVIEESPQLNSTENNIEKEISTIISPIILNEKKDNQEKKRTNSFNPIQNTSMVTETSDNAVLLLRTALEGDKQTCKKILNASPVPYPKQLPTKKSSVHESPSLLKSPTLAPVPMEAPRLEATFVNFNNEVAHMPVITSTVSLAPPAEEQRQSNPTTSQVTLSKRSETNLPQIKVKPISELMPDRRVQNNAKLGNMAGWTVTSANKNDSIVLHASNANLVYVANVAQYTSVPNVPQYTTVNTLPQYTNMANVPQYTSVTTLPQYTSVANGPQYTSVALQQPPALRYPQILCSTNQANAGQAEISRLPDSNERTHRKNPEFVHMHTVELPNNKTTSPFRYFQELLQIHNLVLLESTVGVSYISTTMKCLIKFSLGFQQENNAPVTLCLTLYCDKNVFCIKVRDNASKDIDILKLSANWQWEILKVFKGDIVNKLNLNALKHGLDMSSNVNHFVNLLKAIIFSKEK